MGTSNIAIYVIVFLAVFAPYAFLQLCLGARKPTPDDIDSWNLPPLFRKFYWLTSMLADSVGVKMAELQPARTAKMRTALVQASMKLPAEHVYALEVFLGIFGTIVPAIIVMLLTNRIGYAVGAGLLCGILGLMTPSMKVAKLAEDRIEAIIHSLPFAIDLIGAAMRSGLDFSAAIRYYVSTENKNNPLAIEFGVMLKQMELGKNRIEALEDMARRIQNDDFSSFAGAVAHGTEIGASIVDTMKVQAEEMRRARFNIAERKAARAPSIMILPIAVFIMPAIFIVIGIPVLLKISSSGLGGLMK
ncbi:MAG: type II secretion system F family protein [Victivallales bacterium]|jgi:tight adherence protein C|nr:type II secretion system F family protein [Victivallales bacterium]